MLFNHMTITWQPYLKDFLHLITELGGKLASLVWDKLENFVNDLRQAWNEIVVDIGTIHKENTIICDEVLVKVSHFLLPLSNFNQSLLLNKKLRDQNYKYNSERKRETKREGELKNTSCYLRKPTDLNGKSWCSSVFLWRVTGPFQTEFKYIHQPIVHITVSINLIQGSIQDLFYLIQGIFVFRATKEIQRNVRNEIFISADL